MKNKHFKYNNGMIISILLIIIFFYFYHSYSQNYEDYNKIPQILPTTKNSDDFLLSKPNSDSILYNQKPELYRENINKLLFMISELHFFNPQIYNDIKSQSEFFIKSFDNALITGEFGQYYDILSSIYDEIVSSFDAIILNIVEIPEYIGKIDQIFLLLKKQFFDMINHINILNRKQIYKNGFDIYSKLTYNPYDYIPKGFNTIDDMNSSIIKNY